MKTALIVIVAVLLILSAVFLLWPAPRLGSWTPHSLPPTDLAGLKDKLAEEDARVPDLREGTGQLVVWAGAEGERTPWSVVYLHGFSASRDEIRPVPDLVAAALGANLYFPRLTGHGRSGDAMAEATAEAWMGDAIRALSIGQALGQKVLVIGTSTGATLAALAATDPVLAERIDAAVLISPNFALPQPGNYLLSRPLREHWVGLVLGAEWGFLPENIETERVWTTRYPSLAVLPLGSLLATARAVEPASAQVPALFIYSDADQVVDAGATARWLAEWGGGAERMMVAPGPGVEEQTHVIAGDIRSPGLTAEVVSRIIAFTEDLSEE